jgi:transposase
MARLRRPPTTQRSDGLPTIFPNAAGIDIGADEIVVAVPPDRDAQPVRGFRTFTPDLEALVAWLRACGIDTVAMESTGVYWIAIYELLEQHEIVPYLVNARHVKTVPGRRAIGTTPSGCKSSTRWACYGPRFARMPRSWRCGRWYGIGLS